MLSASAGSWSRRRLLFPAPEGGLVQLVEYKA